MKKVLTTAFLVAAAAGSVYGQVQRKDWHCDAVKSKWEQQRNMAAKPTVASLEEDKYDMKYVKLDISMSNVSTTVAGSVTTIARVVVPSFSSYVFELKDPLVIDSVLIDGAARPFTSSGDVHTVALASPMTEGTLFSAQVFYRGTPVSGTSGTIRGINTLRSPSWGNWATFTLSESYRASDWWPCKQSLKDKIDSADIWITVDDSLKAGSNGLLQAITPVAPGRVRYEWKERYPIVYYLISAAVGKYVDYSYYMRFDGSPDSMLIQNYVYDNPATLPNFKNIIDSTDEQINFFSRLFGRYPFWKEKYGHAMGALSGGMEHQTMSTMGFFQSWLVAHELGHQWFGDNVTCASWSDIVINEGFASYCEYLYIDEFRGRAAATADMRDRQRNVMSSAGGSVYVEDTTSEPRIFSSRLSYDKGACMIHQLRHVINNDAWFFSVLRSWQTFMKDSTGSTMEFRDLTKAMLGSTVNGINIDTFFHQWFYGEGYPMYTARWNQVGSDVFVQLQQSTSMPSSVSLFKVPLEFRLRSATGDTLVRVVHDQSNQLYRFSWGKTMTNLNIDPNAWFIDSVLSITKVTTLDVADAGTGMLNVTPNPTTNSWVATGIADAVLTLCDVTGKAIWNTTHTGSAAVQVPATTLAPGMYLLRVHRKGMEDTVLKLIKE
jgi:aminopeptidase N